MTFEQWWEVTYAGKLGLPPLELAFKEVAKKAWLAGRKEFIDDSFCD